LSQTVSIKANLIRSDAQSSLSFGRRMRTSLLITLIAAVACFKQPAIDVMTLPAVCDTIPPARAAGVRARMPTVSIASDRGAVVGTAVEAGTSRPLAFSDTRLVSVDSPTLAAFLAIADSAGGFVFRAIAPGTYTLRTRAVGHRVEEQRIDVRAGTIDTVRVALRYFTCIGY
jgi:hypothetical protein